MKSYSSKMGSTGFTLIEVLVVIAVISVLAAILMPALQRTRRLAKRLLCGTNLREISLGWDLFLNDHQGRFYQGVDKNYEYGGWRGRIRPFYPRPLNPYVGVAGDANEPDALLFRCPTDRGGLPGFYFNELVYHVRGTSYFTNHFLIGPDQFGQYSDHTADLDAQISRRLPNLNWNRVYAPARLLLVGDFGWVNQWDPKPHRRPEYKDKAEWHNKEETHNLAFLDGHVSFLTIQKGYYVTETYSVVPFKDLYSLARKVQGPVP